MPWSRAGGEHPVAGVGAAAGVAVDLAHHLGVLALAAHDRGGAGHVAREALDRLRVLLDVGARAGARSGRGGGATSGGGRGDGGGLVHDAGRVAGAGHRVVHVDLALGRHVARLDLTGAHDARLDLTGLDRLDRDREGAGRGLGGEAGGLGGGGDLLGESRVVTGRLHVVVARVEGPEQEEREERRAPDDAGHDPPRPARLLRALGVVVADDRRVQSEELLHRQVADDGVAARAPTVGDVVAEGDEHGALLGLGGDDGGDDGLRGAELLHEPEAREEVVLARGARALEVLGADGRDRRRGVRVVVAVAVVAAVVGLALGEDVGDAPLDPLAGERGHRLAGATDQHELLGVRLVDAEHVTGVDRVLLGAGVELRLLDLRTAEDHVGRAVAGQEGEEVAEAGLAGAGRGRAAGLVGGRLAAGLGLAAGVGAGRGRAAGVGVAAAGPLVLALLVAPLLGVPGLAAVRAGDLLALGGGGRVVGVGGGGVGGDLGGLGAGVGRGRHGTLSLVLPLVGAQ